MIQDARGIALNTDNSGTGQLWDQAIAEMLEYRKALGKTAGLLVESDPEFVLGHCLRGYLFLMYAATAFLPKAEAELKAAQALGAKASEHERAHIDALAAWSRGDLETANEAWDRALFEEPTDILALRLQHHNAFWSGRAYLLRDCGLRVLKAWDPDLPHYGNVLGMIAFGMEECGEYERAERLGREAVERSGDDLWAVHAVAHVLEMQARFREGEAWLDYPADAFDDRNPFRGHIWWHRALFLLEQRKYDQALALYDRAIRTETTDFYIDIQNQASLLARLELQDVDIGDRWQDLADLLEARVDDHLMAFTDLHCIMALAAAGRDATIERYLDSLRAFANTPDNTSAAAVWPVTLPVCEAMQAFRSGNPDRTVDLLLPIRYDMHRVGGSHAQRDIFNQFLLEAAIRAGRLPMARALARERVSLKEHSPDNWSKYMKVLEIAGDAAGLAAARQESARVLN